MVQTNQRESTSKSYKSNRISIYTNQKSKSLNSTQLKKINELQINSANIIIQASQELSKSNEPFFMANSIPRHSSTEEGMHSRSNTNPKQLILIQPRLQTIRQLENEGTIRMLESSLKTGIKNDSNQIQFEQLDLSIGTELMSKQKDSIQNTQSRSVSRGKIHNVNQIMIKNENQTKRQQVITRQVLIGNGLSFSNKNLAKHLKKINQNQSLQIVQNGRWEPKRYKKFPRFAVQSGDQVKLSQEQYQKLQNAYQTREFAQQFSELKLQAMGSDQNTQYFDNTQVSLDGQIAQSNMRRSHDSNFANPIVTEPDHIKLPDRISNERKSQEFTINKSSMQLALNQFQKTNQVHERIDTNRNNGIAKSNYESQGEKTTVKSQGSDKKINNASSRQQIFSVPSQNIVQINNDSKKFLNQKQFNSSATLAQKLDTITKSQQKSEHDSLVPKSEEDNQYKNTFTKIVDMQKLQKKMESIASQKIESGLESEKASEVQKFPSPRYESNNKTIDPFENILQLKNIENQVLISNRTLNGTNNVISNTYKVIHQRFQANQLASSLKNKLQSKNKQLYPVDPDFLSSYLGDLALDLELKNMSQIEKNELIKNLKIIREWQIQKKQSKLPKISEQTDLDETEKLNKSSPTYDKDEIQIVIEQLQSEASKKSRTSDRNKKNMVAVQLSDKQNQLTHRDEQTIEAIVYNEQEFFNTNQSFLANTSQQNSQSISRQTPHLIKKSKQALRDLIKKQSANQFAEDIFQPVIGIKKEIYKKNAEVQTKSPYQQQQDFEININVKSANTFSSVGSNRDPYQNTLELQSNLQSKHTIVNIQSKPALSKKKEIETQKLDEQQNKDTIKIQSDIDVENQQKGKIKKIQLTDSMTSSQLLEPKVPKIVSKQSKSIFKDKESSNKKDDLDELLKYQTKSQARRFSGVSNINSKDLISNHSAYKKSEPSYQKSVQDEKGEFIIDEKSNKEMSSKYKNDKMIPSQKISQKSIQKMSRLGNYQQFDSTHSLKEERTNEESGQMEIAVTVGTRRNLEPIQNQQRSQALMMSDFSLSSRNNDWKNNLVQSLLRTNEISEVNELMKGDIKETQQILSSQKYKFTAGFRKQSKIISQQQARQTSTSHTQINFRPGSPNKVEIKTQAKQEVQPLFLYQALQKANEQNLDLITYVLEDLALKYIKTQPESTSQPPQEVKRQINPNHKTRIKNMINDIYSKEKRYIPRGILIGSDRDPSLFINSQDLILDLTKAKGISLTNQKADDKKENKMQGENMEMARIVKQMKQQQIIVLQEQKKIEEIAKQYSNLTVSQQETPDEDTINAASYKISRQRSHKVKYA